MAWTDKAREAALRARRLNAMLHKKYEFDLLQHNFSQQLAGKVEWNKADYDKLAVEILRELKFDDAEIDKFRKGDELPRIIEPRVKAKYTFQVRRFLERWQQGQREFQSKKTGAEKLNTQQARKYMADVLRKGLNKRIEELAKGGELEFPDPIRARDALELRSRIGNLDYELEKLDSADQPLRKELKEIYHGCMPNMDADPTDDGRPAQLNVGQLVAKWDALKVKLPDWVGANDEFNKLDAVVLRLKADAAEKMAKGVGDQLGVEVKTPEVLTPGATPEGTPMQAGSAIPENAWRKARLNYQKALRIRAAVSVLYGEAVDKGDTTAAAKLSLLFTGMSPGDDQMNVGQVLDFWEKNKGDLPAWVFPLPQYQDIDDGIAQLARDAGFGGVPQVGTAQARQDARDAIAVLWGDKQLADPLDLDRLRRNLEDRVEADELKAAWEKALAGANPSTKGLPAWALLEAAMDRLLRESVPAPKGDVETQIRNALGVIRSDIDALGIHGYDDLYDKLVAAKTKGELAEAIQAWDARVNGAPEWNDNMKDRMKGVIDALRPFRAGAGFTAEERRAERRAAPSVVDSWEDSAHLRREMLRNNQLPSAMAEELREAAFKFDQNNQQDNTEAADKVRDFVYYASGWNPAVDEVIRQWDLIVSDWTAGRISGDANDFDAVRQVMRKLANAVVEAQNSPSAIGAAPAAPNAVRAEISTDQKDLLVGLTAAVWGGKYVANARKPFVAFGQMLGAYWARGQESYPNGVPESVTRDKAALVAKWDEVKAAASDSLKNFNEFRAIDDEIEKLRRATPPVVTGGQSIRIPESDKQRMRNAIDVMLVDPKFAAQRDRLNKIRNAVDDDNWAIAHAHTRALSYGLGDETKEGMRYKQLFDKLEELQKDNGRPVEYWRALDAIYDAYDAKPARAYVFARNAFVKDLFDTAREWAQQLDTSRQQPIIDAIDVAQKAVERQQGFVAAHHGELEAIPLANRGAASGAVSVFRKRLDALGDAPEAQQAKKVLDRLDAAATDTAAQVAAWEEARWELQPRYQGMWLQFDEMDDKFRYLENPAAHSPEYWKAVDALYAGYYDGSVDEPVALEARRRLEAGEVSVGMDQDPKYGPLLRAAVGAERRRVAALQMEARPQAGTVLPPGYRGEENPAPLPRVPIPNFPRPPSGYPKVFVSYSEDKAGIPDAPIDARIPVPSPAGIQLAKGRRWVPAVVDRKFFKHDARIWGDAGVSSLSQEIDQYGDRYFTKQDTTGNMRMLDQGARERVASVVCAAMGAWSPPVFVSKDNDGAPVGSLLSVKDWLETEHPNEFQEVIWPAGDMLHVDSLCTVVNKAASDMSDREWAAAKAFDVVEWARFNMIDGLMAASDRHGKNWFLGVRKDVAGNVVGVVPIAIDNGLHLEGRNDYGALSNYESDPAGFGAIVGDNDGHERPSASQLISGTWDYTTRQPTKYLESFFRMALREHQEHPGSERDRYLQQQVLKAQRVCQEALAHMSPEQFDATVDEIPDWSFGHTGGYGYVGSTPDVHRGFMKKLYRVRHEAVVDAVGDGTFVLSLQTPEKTKKYLKDAVDAGVVVSNEEVTSYWTGALLYEPPFVHPQLWKPGQTPAAEGKVKIRKMQAEAINIGIDALQDAINKVPWGKAKDNKTRLQEIELNIEQLKGVVDKGGGSQDVVEKAMDGIRRNLAELDIQGSFQDKYKPQLAKASIAVYEVLNPPVPLSQRHEQVKGLMTQFVAELGKYINNQRRRGYPAAPEYQDIQERANKLAFKLDRNLPLDEVKPEVEEFRRILKDKSGGQADWRDADYPMLKQLADVLGMPDDASAAPVRSVITRGVTGDTGVFLKRKVHRVVDDLRDVLGKQAGVNNDRVRNFQSAYDYAKRVKTALDRGDALYSVAYNWDVAVRYMKRAFGEQDEDADVPAMKKHWQDALDAQVEFKRKRAEYDAEQAEIARLAAEEDRRLRRERKEKWQKGYQDVGVPENVYKYVNKMRDVNKQDWAQQYAAWYFGGKSGQEPYDYAIGYRVMNKVKDDIRRLEREAKLVADMPKAGLGKLEQTEGGGRLSQAPAPQVVKAMRERSMVLVDVIDKVKAKRNDVNEWMVIPSALNGLQRHGRWFARLSFQADDKDVQKNNANMLLLLERLKSEVDARRFDEADYKKIRAAVEGIRVTRLVWERKAKVLQKQGTVLPTAEQATERGKAGVAAVNEALRMARAHYAGADPADKRKLTRAIKQMEALRAQLGDSGLARDWKNSAYQNVYRDVYNVLPYPFLDVATKLGEGGDVFKVIKAGDSPPIEAVKLLQEVFDDLLVKTQARMDNNPEGSDLYQRSKALNVLVKKMQTALKKGEWSKLVDIYKEMQAERQKPAGNDVIGWWRLADAYKYVKPYAEA